MVVLARSPSVLTQSTFLVEFTFRVLFGNDHQTEMQVIEESMQDEEQ